MRTWIYGAGNPAGNEARCAEVHEAHNATLRADFHDRPKGLLVLDLPAGDGWPELCEFLGVETLHLPFIHANNASIRDSYWRYAVNWCQQVRHKPPISNPTS